MSRQEAFREVRMVPMLLEFQQEGKNKWFCSCWALMATGKTKHDAYENLCAKMRAKTVKHV